MGLKEQLDPILAGMLEEEERNPYAEAIVPTIKGTLQELVEHPGKSLLGGAEYLFEWPGAFVRGAWTSGEDEPLSLLAAGAKTMGRHFAGRETPTGQEAMEAQFGKGIAPDSWWGPIASQIVTNPLDVATLPLIPKDIAMAARHIPGAVAKLRHPLQLAKKAPAALKAVRKAIKEAPPIKLPTLEEALPTVMKPLKKFKDKKAFGKYLEDLKGMRTNNVEVLVKERAKLSAKSGPTSDEVMWSGIEKGEVPRVPEAPVTEMSKKQWHEFLDRARKGKLDMKETSSLINVGVDGHLYLRPPAGGDQAMYVHLNRILPKKYGRYLVALKPGDLYDYYRLEEAGVGIVLPKAGRKWWGTRVLPDGREVADLPDWMKTVLNKVNKESIADLNIWIRDLKDPRLKEIFKSYPAHYDVASKTVSMAPPEAIDRQIVADVLFKKPVKLAEKHVHPPYRKLLGKEPTRHARQISYKVRPKGEGLNLLPGDMSTISQQTRKGWEYFLAHEVGHHVSDTSLDIMRKANIGYQQVRSQKGESPLSDITAYNEYIKHNKKYKEIKPTTEALRKAKVHAKKMRDAVFPDDPTYYNNFKAMTEHWPMFDWNVHAYKTAPEFTANAFAQIVANDMYQSPEFLAAFPPVMRDALRRMMSRNYALRMPIKLGKHKLLSPIPKFAENEFLTIGDMPKITTEELRRILPKPAVEKIKLTEELVAREWRPIVESVPPKVVGEVKAKTAKNLGRTFGIEEGRTLKAVAARNKKTGEIIVGKPGQIHASLWEKASVPEWEWGYVDDLGNYYTRAEAKAAFGSGEAMQLGVGKGEVVDFDAIVKDRYHAISMGDQEAIKVADNVIIRDFGPDKLGEAISSNLAQRFKDAKKLIKQGSLSTTEKKRALKRVTLDIRQAKKDLKFTVRTAKLNAEMAEIKKPGWEPPIPK